MCDGVAKSANDNTEIKRLNTGKPEAEDGADNAAESQGDDVEGASPQPEAVDASAESPIEAASETDAANEAEASPDEQIRDLKDQLLRALAEVENTRRRAQRDKEDMAKYAIANFARDVLAVSDNLARAMDAVPEESRTGDSAMETLYEGVGLTQRELNTAMERHGIKPIDPLGEKFDHNFHQAMYEVEDADADPGTVVQVAQLGYVIGERLLRPAMVGVSKKPVPREQTEAPADQAPDGEAGETDSGAHLDTKA